MRIGAAVVWLAAAALAAVALAAEDDLTDQKAVLQGEMGHVNPSALFPLDPQRTWVHRTVQNGRSVDIITTVSAGSQGDAELRSRISDRVVRRRAFRLQGGGVYRVGFGERGEYRLSPPMPWIPAGKPGTVIGWKGLLVNGSERVAAEAAVRVGVWETVETTAGPMRAVRIDTSARAHTHKGTQVQRSTGWFAPQIGLVREEADTPNGPVVMTLVSIRR